jgi:hypothetical protein
MSGLGFYLRGIRYWVSGTKTVLSLRTFADFCFSFSQV